MKPLYINGKFTAQSVTGVQRVALELVLAIDALLDEPSAQWRARSCVLLCPPGGKLPALRHIRVLRVGQRLHSLQLWEQLALPIASRDGILLNLSGSAPMAAAQRSFCLLHDAAVFDHPATYTCVFRLWYRWLFRWLSRHALGLLTVSEFSRQRLCDVLQASSGRFRLLRNGADHFARLPARTAILGAHNLIPRRYLLVVGTAKQTKNVEAVLAAWRELERPADARLVWVGGQNPRVFAGAQQVLRQARLDRGQGILRVGFVADESLKALYMNAAGLILPSRYEGFGLPAVEAMICGCPVAAARAASLPEVCGEAALLFDPDDVREIGNCMKRLLADDVLRERLSQAGVARAATYRWSDAARVLLSHADGDGEGGEESW